MRAFVITLKDNQYSEKLADRCIESAAKHGLEVKKFYGIDKEHAIETMQNQGLKWTWAENNTKKTVCPITGLHQNPYRTNDLRNRIGCFMSHYMLWDTCVTLNEEFVILEHDAVFIHDFPQDIEFKGICQLNDPNGCTPKGQQWSNIMKKRGGIGVFPKTPIRVGNEKDIIPDGLAGNSAYIIKPWAAAELINKTNELGVWPNDAIMNLTIFPYLEEYFPFITKVEQTKSTTSD